MDFLLKRRLNPFLLLTTVVGLSLLVGLSIVYQTQFEEIAGERSDKETEIQELNNKIDSLNQNNTILTERNEELENRTIELEDEIESIESEESGLEEQVGNLQNQTDQLREERNEYRDDFESIQLDIRQLCEQEDLQEDSSETICDIWAEGWDDEN